MPWYRAGTVNVTLNNTTVSGTGTAFAANSRVGDAFLGPDGRWYEVANIASDTVLSILPAYQGATAAAGTYALAPIQGYVKASADQLRSIVASFGDKMAALGTTGNYDTLPVNKGGTGRTALADSVQALLGSDLSSAVQALLSSSDQAGARSAIGAVAKGGDTMAGALNEAPPVPLASAATVAVGGAAANTVTITGTATIAALDTIAAGARRTLVFTDAATLAHDGVKLILPGAANIVASAGDVAEFESLGGGNWRCLAYFRAASLPDVVRSVAQGGTGSTTPAGAQAALGVAGNRNLLINPRFQVNQRNYAGGTATTVANQYTVDRWKVVTLGQNMSLSGGFAVCPAGGLAQVVDGADIISGTYTLSWSGTATATVAGVAVANGGQVTLTAGTNVTINFLNGTLQYPKLEAGSVKTTWNDLPVADTMRLCQRYFVRFTTSTAAGTALCKGVVAAGLTSAARAGMPWPVKMRAVPAVTFSGCQAYDGTNLATVNSMASYCTTDVLDGDFALASAMAAAGPPAMIFLTNTASYLQADAEL